MAFVLEHPAVTSAIIGPRTYEQLEDLLACADMHLLTETLYRIDKLMPPGTSINGIDGNALPVWSNRREGAARRTEAYKPVCYLCGHTAALGLDIAAHRSARGRMTT